MKQAVQDNCFSRCAVRGLSGAGKTYFAMCWAIGLWDKLGRKNPIFFMDTENSLSYILPNFERLGIKVQELRSRRIADAKDFFNECEKAEAIGIIDSITHLGEDMQESYMRDKKIKRLRIWDWNPLKYEWRKSILEPMARSPIHYTVCGRLAFKYEAIEVEDTTVMAATDSKMSAEKNTEYETALTIEMERFNLTDAEMQVLGKAIKHNQPVRTYARAARYRMTVIKDKMGALSGKVIEFDPNDEWVEPNNALWLSLAPHINRLKLGGKYVGLDVEKTSAGMFGSADTSWAEAEREKTILLEEVEAEMKTRFGQSKDDKSAGIALLKDAFGTPSWTAIQGMPLDRIQAGHAKIVPPAPEVKHAEIRDVPGPVDKLKADLAGEDIPVDNSELINQLKVLYAKPLVLRDDMAAALNLCEYDAGADPANIRNEIKSTNANNWKLAIGRLIAWLEGGAR